MRAHEDKERRLSEETGVNRIPQRLRFLNNLEIKLNCCWALISGKKLAKISRENFLHTASNIVQNCKGKRKP